MSKLWERWCEFWSGVWIPDFPVDVVESADDSGHDLGPL